MMRVDFQDSASALTLRVEGRLVGTSAEELRNLVAHGKLPPRLVVDLSDVTFVDDLGEQMLSWLGRIGTEFVAESSYPRDVCERLHLLLVDDRTLP